MILLALAKTEKTLGHSSIKTQCTSIFVHSLAATDYPTSPRRNSLPPPSHQYSRNIQRLFINTPKSFKDFSSTTRKSSKTFHQEPENIQRLFRLQNCPSRRSSICRKYSKTLLPAGSNQQQQPAAANSSSNQQAVFQPQSATSSSNQKQQPPAANSSSNQQAVFQPQPAIVQQPAATSKQYSSRNQQSPSNQQQPTAAINRSNQLQQPAAINSSNKQRQPAFILLAAPTRSTPASVSYHYGS